MSAALMLGLGLVLIPTSLAAQDLGVIRGHLIDGSGWNEPAPNHWVGLARFDSVIAETQTDAEGHFEFTGEIGEYREVHLFTYLAPCFHPIRIGTEFVAPADADILRLVARPGSKGTGLSDSFCAPTRKTHERVHDVLTRS